MNVNRERPPALRWPGDRKDKQQVLREMVNCGTGALDPTESIVVDRYLHRNLIRDEPCADSCQSIEVA